MKCINLQTFFVLKPNTILTNYFRNSLPDPSKAYYKSSKNQNRLFLARTLTPIATPVNRLSEKQSITADELSFKIEKSNLKNINITIAIGSQNVKLTITIK